MPPGEIESEMKIEEKHKDGPGPIALNWNEVERRMELRDIPSLDALARQGDLPGTTLYQLSRGLSQISTPDLARLCEVLRCQPGDLLSYRYIATHESK